MTNIHDFKTAIEQKQKRLEMKEKHMVSSKLFEKELMQILEQSGFTQQIKDDFKEINKEFMKHYSKLANSYSDLAIEYKKLTETIENATENAERNCYLNGLVEHFIVKNELEDDFVTFLKDVSENENVQGYRNAAKSQVEFYHFNIQGNEFYQIQDEYGWMKEEDMEEIN